MHTVLTPSEHIGERTSSKRTGEEGELRTLLIAREVRIKGVVHREPRIAVDEGARGSALAAIRA